MKKSILAPLVLCSSSVFAEININMLDWVVINDSVMGGVSQSRLVVGSNNLVFDGNVSLANNGGFASFRANHSLENSQVDQLRVKVKGDGKYYQIRLRVDDYVDGPAFVYSFKTQKGESQVINLTENDFKLMYRGRQFQSSYQFNFSDVRSIGFMIGKKQTGRFTIEIEGIEITQKI
jgi:hypothetical protein